MESGTGSTHEREEDQILEKRGGKRKGRKTEEGIWKKIRGSKREEE